MSLLSILTVLFVALKLLGKIDWSWWLVFAPTLFHFGFWFVLFSLAAYAKSNEPKYPRWK